MTSRGRVRKGCCRRASGNALLRWSAVIRPKAVPAGRSDWSPQKPSNTNWSRKWDEQPFACCSLNTTSSRGGKKMWCVPELDEAYIRTLEDVLETYEKPYHPTEPVICLDEKPVTLHAHVRPPAPVAPGREARYDNEYERCGTANVFCAVEPKIGKPLTFATPSRAGAEFAQVVCHLGEQLPGSNDDPPHTRQPHYSPTKVVDGLLRRGDGELALESVHHSLHAPTWKLAQPSGDRN
jgi:DDE superfamily endonuclease